MEAHDQGSQARPGVVVPTPVSCTFCHLFSYPSQAPSTPQQAHALTARALTYLCRSCRLPAAGSCCCSSRWAQRAWGHSGAGNPAESSCLGALCGGRRCILRPLDLAATPSLHPTPASIKPSETTSKGCNVRDGRGLRKHLLHFTSKETKLRPREGVRQVQDHIANYGREGLEPTSLALAALDSFVSMGSCSGTLLGSTGRGTVSLIHCTAQGLQGLLQG